jgi:hypothetical protein
MSAQEHLHVALPKLYGAPSYSRPRQVAPPSRPFDPDDLPLEAYRSDEGEEAAGLDATDVADPGISLEETGDDQGAVGALPVTEQESRRLGVLARMLGGGDHR